MLTAMRNVYTISYFQLFYFNTIDVFVVEDTRFPTVAKAIQLYFV